jgi:hypothetical protein
VGWTETANISTVVYDNNYIGYACAFNSQGDVEILLHATGEAGLHFIDLYPAIDKGKETRPLNFRIPQLSYADDHPGEDLPVFALLRSDRTQSARAIASFNVGGAGILRRRRKNARWSKFAFSARPSPAAALQRNHYRLDKGPGTPLKKSLGAFQKRPLFAGGSKL